MRGTFRIFRVFSVSVSNRWFRKSDRPALGWPALGDREFRDKTLKNTIVLLVRRGPVAGKPVEVGLRECCWTALQIYPNGRRIAGPAKLGLAPKVLQNPRSSAEPFSNKLSTVWNVPQNLPSEPQKFRRIPVNLWEPGPFFGWLASFPLIQEVWWSHSLLWNSGYGGVKSLKIGGGGWKFWIFRGLKLTPSYRDSIENHHGVKSPSLRGATFGASSPTLWKGTPERTPNNLGRTPRGSCNNTLLRRIPRRFSNSKCFLDLKGS